MTGFTKEFKAKWLTALTDGSFVRRTMVLGTGKQRCCLGVVRALLKRTGLEKDHYLTQVELEESGLASCPTPEGEDDIQVYLGVLNDDNHVPDGMYYPQEVIDAITALPTVD